MNSTRSNRLDFCIGDTPLVKINSLSQKYNTNIWAKIEGLNPGLSIKDRIVHYMLDEAEKRGDIAQGHSTIVEASSGNTGHSLAMIAAIRGYKCIVTVKRNSSEEKKKLMKLLGAEVVLCPSGIPASDPNSYYQKAKSIAASIPGGYYLNQNFNEDNYLAHYKFTGPEILNQTKDFNLTHVIAASSTGGTISGIGKCMKEQKPDVKVIAADCHGSSLSQWFYNCRLDSSVKKRTDIEGLGKDIVPANFKKEYIDQVVTVDDALCVQSIRDLLKNDGIFVGGSSGAVIQVLNEIQHTISPNDNIVLVFADHGSKYLSKYFDTNWKSKFAKSATKASLTNM